MRRPSGSHGATPPLVRAVACRAVAGRGPARRARSQARDTHGRRTQRGV